MSAKFLPCGVYHEDYKHDHAFWQTKFVKGKMILLFLLTFVFIPMGAGSYWLSVCNQIGYTVLCALGVQLLIGYTGLITLGHAAFVAVGAYTSTLLVLQFHWPQFFLDWGLAYPFSIIVAGLAAGLWSVLFGLPSAKVKGFYLILTTMAAQFITVDFILTQYVSQIGGRGQAFSLPPGTIKIGPWIIDDEVKVYYLMAVLVTLMVFALANLVRSRPGRAWIAIRDNDISAEVMGINIVWYKLLAFFVAGFMAGIAGAFWVSNTAALSPEHFTWSWSLWLVGVILIGGVGSVDGIIFGSIFMVLVMELLQMATIYLGDFFPQLMMKFLYVKESAFGLAICAFLIYEPRGLSYRWWQIKNYFNLWPFSY
ncbi:MAG: branched-chain amino acid ABC transporter permease [Deltaproteobacteria bacterium]|nr:branched-chain amino acid ABC transporter permease [Deltaproteobacteria bacterium]